MSATTAVAVHPMSPKRRARLARTLFVFSALVLVMAGMVFNQSALATDQPITGESAFNYISVMPGDSLWDLAQTYAEGKNQQDWIAEVILLNNLSSANLETGDRLALP
jgi:cell division protein YceG involved in septum cleavage